MRFPKRDKLKVQGLIKQAEANRSSRLNLIASENYLPPQAGEAAASLAFQEKYAEGYPNARFYKGNEVPDLMEQMCIDYAKKIFQVEHANVQPHSGTTANNAAYRAIIGNKRGKILGLDLSHGGHLSHGSKPSSISKEFDCASYYVDDNGLIDLDKLETIAKSFRPDIIVSGGSAVPYEIDWEEMDKIAQKHGAYHVADISHTAGLIAAGVHKSPAPYCDLITTTTHKTLRCARGAMILVPNKKYRHNDKINLAKKVDSAVFPGSQGGPLLNMIAAKLAGMELILREDHENYDGVEAIDPNYVNYQVHVITNMLGMIKTFDYNEIPLLAHKECSTHPTHMCVLDLRERDGMKFENGEYYSTILESVGIIVNKNGVPNDPLPPTKTSGIRIGTPAVTTQGLDENDCSHLARYISNIIKEPESEKRQYEAAEFVDKMCREYPIS